MYIELLQGHIWLAFRLSLLSGLTHMNPTFSRPDPTSEERRGRRQLCADTHIRGIESQPGPLAF